MIFCQSLFISHSLTFCFSVFSSLSQHNLISLQSRIFFLIFVPYLSPLCLITFSSITCPFSIMSFFLSQHSLISFSSLHQPAFFSFLSYLHLTSFHLCILSVFLTVIVSILSRLFLICVSHRFLLCPITFSSTNCPCANVSLFHLNSLISFSSLSHLNSFQLCIPPLSHLCLTSISCPHNHFQLHLTFPSSPHSVLCSAVLHFSLI